MRFSKFRTKLFFTTVLASLLLALSLPGPALAQESEFSGSGYDTLRIESEDKLNVPLDKEEEVWQYMQETYLRNGEALKQLHPEFNAYHYEEFFIDTYFDTPSLQLLQMQSGVRHRRRTNLTDEDHEKSGRELIQVKVSGISENALNRGEYKYPVEYPMPFKGLLGLVAKSERGELENRLESLGLDPDAMEPILTIFQTRRRVYINQGDQPFMSISFDHVSSSALWAKVELVEIEPELNEVGYTEADPATRELMEAIAAKISADILDKFPYVERDLTPKYNKTFAVLEQRIPFYRTLIYYRLNSLGFLALIACFLLLLAVLSIHSYRTNRPPQPKNAATPRGRYDAKVRGATRPDTA
jgi:hypothetical protein